MDPRKQIDTIFEAIQASVQDDVTSLLGIEFLLTDVEKNLVTKADYFNNLAGNQICAKMDVAGEVEGSGGLFVDIKNAILLAGTLIMLPHSELDEIVASEDYNDEIEDSYGEIINIIFSSFNLNFGEMYPKSCRFLRKEQERVVPLKVEIESDEPVKNEIFYRVGFSMILDGTPMGEMGILLPAVPFDIQLDSASTVEPSEPVESVDIAEVQEPQKENLHVLAATGADHLDDPVDILLIGDDEDEVAKLRDVLGGSGYVVQVLSLKDNVHNFISKELKAVYLVTRDVDEQVFGMAIKVSSACSLPLIAAAPGWTKTKVIKAVKYGVRDILLTPANTEDIEENIANNLVRMAA